MRKITVIMVSSMLAGMLASSQVAEAGSIDIPIRYACRFQREDGRAGWSPAESQHAIRCAFALFAPAQTAYALEIAYRESRYSATATNPATPSACRWENPYGSCGLFQHLMRYWPGRVRAYGRWTWFPRTWPRVPWSNARANAIITARMVAAQGWSAWGG